MVKGIAFSGNLNIVKPKSGKNPTAAADKSCPAI